MREAKRRPIGTRLAPDSCKYEKHAQKTYESIEKYTKKSKKCPKQPQKREKKLIKKWYYLEYPTTFGTPSEAPERAFLMVHSVHFSLYCLEYREYSEN